MDPYNEGRAILTEVMILLDGVDDELDAAIELHWQSEGWHEALAKLRAEAHRLNVWAGMLRNSAECREPVG